MANYTTKVLENGSTLITVEGNIKEFENALINYISQISKKTSSIIINLEKADSASQKLFEIISELNARTRFKVVSKNQFIIQECNKYNLATFPTVKSATLSILGEETINAILKRLIDVPISNLEAYTLIGYTFSENATFEGLEKLIKDNPCLVSQILRIANSSYFARKIKAETLQQAMSTLGFSNLRQIFLYNFYNSVAGLFKSQIQVIEHGKKCAKLAEYISLSAETSHEERQKVRMGALLHDIGRMALAYFFPQKYEQVSKLIVDNQIPSHLAELTVFGTEHQIVGSLLCNKWNFPSYLCSIISDHHSLQAQNWNALTLPVFVANNFLHEIEGVPFSPYYSKLEGYFFIKRKDLPWENFNEAFLKVLQEPNEFD